MSFFDTLLVPIDFSSHSSKALDYTIALVKTFGGSIHLLHSYRLSVYAATLDHLHLGRDFWSAVRESAGQKLDRALRKIAAAGIEEGTHWTHVSEMSPAEAIVETAEKIGADLIVMGTRGLTGVKHVLLGSVAERTIRMAPCPVMTVKDTLQVTKPAWLRTILVPIDFSSHSENALDYAIALTKALGGRIYLLHAYDLGIQVPEPDHITQYEDFYAALQDSTGRKLDKVVEKLTAAGIESSRHVSEMPPTTAIPLIAGKIGADLIVMGTRGLTDLKHVLLGRTAERTIRMAPCPVMTVKEGSR